MKTWRKGTALLLVGMMIMSGLVAFMSAPVLADTQVTLNNVTWTAAYADANMIDHPGINAADEDLVINEVGNGASDTLLYLGDRGRTLQFNVQPNVANAGPNHTFTVTITPASGNDLITVDAGNNGQTIDTWPIGNFTWYTVDFAIDIGNQGNVETMYEMVCTIRNDNTSATVTFPFWIYVSSVFHDDTNDNTCDTAHEFTRDSGEYIVDNSAGGDAPFEAGDMFKEGALALTNFAWFDIQNPQANLSAPTDDKNNIVGQDITLVKPNCKIERIINAGSLVQDAANNPLVWRVNVEERTPPGVTQGNVIMNYERQINGVYSPIIENVRPIDFAVDFSFADADVASAGDGAWSPFLCYATSVSIVDDGTATRQVDYAAPYAVPTLEQSTYTDRKIRVNVSIVNNGNVELNNVVFGLFPGGWGPGSYFRNPKFFYHETGVLGADGITLTVASMPVGGTPVNFTIEMIVASNIPIGEHRLPIEYDGFYYDGSQLGGSTAFRPIDDGDINTGNNMEIIFSIQVTDSVIACHVNAAIVTTAGDKAGITAENIAVDIRNDEGYNFIDVMVRANFTGTPWYMPVIGMSNPWIQADNANPAMPMAAWPATGVISPTFTVDTNPNMTPDRYPFQLEITAVIEETLEVVTVVIDYNQGAVIDYAGYGPEVFISAFTADSIVPGQAFNLDLVLQNSGDDTLRDVTVFIPTDGTDPAPWIVEQQFKQQFDWSNVYQNWMDVTGPVNIPDGMFYTVKDLDVDNIREIYEINLYVDGIYSRPSARIAMVHINDLAPGASINVTFEMYTDKDMVNGKPYDFQVAITGTDSAGTTTTVNRGITVMSSLPGTSYNPVELNWFDAGIKALGLFLFFIIVLAILLFVYNMFKGEPYDEDEDDFDFEDDEPDFEPAPPPAPVDEAPLPPPESEELVEP